MWSQSQVVRAVRITLPKASYKTVYHSALLIAIGFMLMVPLLVEQLSFGLNAGSTTVIAGENAEISSTLRSPWRETIDFIYVFAGCSCSSASVTPMTIPPRSTFVVRVAFNSKGRPPGRHFIDVRAMARDGVVYDVPVRFEFDVVPAMDK